LQIDRGDLWWADLPDPVGSSPRYRRPVVVIQSNYFNHSRLATVMVASCSRNLSFANMPGNFLLNKTQTGLALDSVVKLTQIMTIDRSQLTDWIGRLPQAIIKKIDERIVFALNLDLKRSPRNGR
jgi:mRNA interferase MazF